MKFLLANLSKGVYASRCARQAMQQMMKVTISCVSPRNPGRDMSEFFPDVVKNVVVRAVEVSHDDLAHGPFVRA